MVNSGLPLMKARVPSSGSTRKNASRVAGTRPAATASSAMTGMPGAARCSPSVSTSSASWSAMVTGVVSAFVSTVHAGRKVRHLDAARPPARREATPRPVDRIPLASCAARTLDSLAGPGAGQAAAQGRSGARFATARRAHRSGRPLHRMSGACIRRQEHFASGPCSLQSSIPAFVGTLPAAPSFGSATS